MHRFLVQATVVGVNDGSVLYPSCLQCYAKMLHNLHTDRWQCVRCNIRCRESDLSWRYRLSLCIADMSATCNLSLFGGTLVQHFGCPASSFHQFLHGADTSRHRVEEETVLEAVQTALVGNRYVFCLKTARLPQHGTSTVPHPVLRPAEPPTSKHYCLTDLLSAVPPASQKVDGKLADFVAVQMVPVGTRACADTPTVLSILKRLVTDHQNTSSLGERVARNSQPGKERRVSPRKGGLLRKRCCNAGKRRTSCQFVKCPCTPGDDGSCAELDTSENQTVESEASSGSGFLSQSSCSSQATLRFSCQSSMDQEFASSVGSTSSGGECAETSHREDPGCSGENGKGTALTSDRVPSSEISDVSHCHAQLDLSADDSFSDQDDVCLKTVYHERTFPSPPGTSSDSAGEPPHNLDNCDKTAPHLGKELNVGVAYLNEPVFNTTAQDETVLDSQNTLANLDQSARNSSIEEFLCEQRDSQPHELWQSILKVADGQELSASFSTSLNDSSLLLAAFHMNPPQDHSLAHHLTDQSQVESVTANTQITHEVVSLKLFESITKARHTEDSDLLSQDRAKSKVAMDLESMQDLPDSEDLSMFLQAIAGGQGTVSPCPHLALDTVMEAAQQAGEDTENQGHSTAHDTEHQGHSTAHDTEHQGHSTAHKKGQDPGIWIPDSSATQRRDNDELSPDLFEESIHSPSVLHEGLSFPSSAGGPPARPRHVQSTEKYPGPCASSKKTCVRHLGKNCVCGEESEWSLFRRGQVKDLQRSSSSICSSHLCRISSHKDPGAASLWNKFDQTVLHKNPQRTSSPKNGHRHCSHGTQFNSGSSGNNPQRTPFNSGSSGNNPQRTPFNSGSSGNNPQRTPFNSGSSGNNPQRTQFNSGSSGNNPQRTPFNSGSSGNNPQRTQFNSGSSGNNPQRTVSNLHADRTGLLIHPHGIDSHKNPQRYVSNQDSHDCVSEKQCCEAKLPIGALRPKVQQEGQSARSFHGCGEDSRSSAFSRGELSAVLMPDSEGLDAFLSNLLDRHSQPTYSDPPTRKNTDHVDSFSQHTQSHLESPLPQTSQAVGVAFGKKTNLKRKRKNSDHMDSFSRHAESLIVLETPPQVVGISFVQTTNVERKRSVDQKFNRKRSLQNDLCSADGLVWSSSQTDDCFLDGSADLFSQDTDSDVGTEERVSAECSLDTWTSSQSTGSGVKVNLPCRPDRLFEAEDQDSLRTIEDSSSSVDNNTGYSLVKKSDHHNSLSSTQADDQYMISSQVPHHQQRRRVVFSRKRRISSIIDIDVRLEQYSSPQQHRQLQLQQRDAPPTPQRSCLRQCRVPLSSPHVSPKAMEEKSVKPNFRSALTPITAETCNVDRTLRLSCTQGKTAKLSTPVICRPQAASTHTVCSSTAYVGKEQLTQDNMTGQISGSQDLFSQCSAQDQRKLDGTVIQDTPKLQERSTARNNSARTQRGRENTPLLSSAFHTPRYLSGFNSSDILFDDSESVPENDSVLQWTPAPCSPSQRELGVRGHAGSVSGAVYTVAEDMMRRRSVELDLSSVWSMSPDLFSP